MRRLLTPLAWSLADALADEVSQWACMDGLTVGSLCQVLRARDSSHPTGLRLTSAGRHRSQPRALSLGFTIFHYWGCDPQ